MNALQRCVLTLYTYDSNPDDITPENALRQSLELINKLPLIAVYLSKEFQLYDTIEQIAGELIMRKHKVNKNVCANVDFYSGFVYTMRGIPEELFTPIFAIARIPGWCAHRLEELLNGNRIIRPAYKYVGVHVKYEREK